MMETRGRQRVRCLIWGSCILASPSLAQAQEGTRAIVDISSGAEVSSNPFLTADGNEAAEAYIEIDPRVFLEDGRHQTVLGGSFRLSQFTNGYGLDESASVRIESRRALAERTSLNLRASVYSARPSLRDQLTSGANTSLDENDVDLPEPVDFDPTNIGTRTRTTNLTISGSIEHQLSEIETFEGTATIAKSYFGDAAGIDYTDASLSLAYIRQLTSKTNIGLQGNFSLTDYDESIVGNEIINGDANVYEITATVGHNLDTRWAAKAALGVNLVDRSSGPADHKSDFLFVANAALCRSGLQTEFCITASRSAQPTALAGVSTVTSIGASYEYRLNEDNTFSVGSFFGRSERGRADVFGNDAASQNVMGISARFRHNLSDRASLLIHSAYSDIESPQRNVAADYSVNLGISFRLGSLY